MNAIRLIGYASLAVTVCAGCGPTAATSDNPVVAEPPVAVHAKGKQTVTFRVQEMGQRLKLL